MFSKPFLYVLTFSRRSFFSMCIALYAVSLLRRGMVGGVAFVRLVVSDAYCCCLDSLRIIILHNKT